MSSVSPDCCCLAATGTCVCAADDVVAFVAVATAAVDAGGLTRFLSVGGVSVGTDCWAGAADSLGVDIEGVSTGLAEEGFELRSEFEAVADTAVAVVVAAVVAVDITVTEDASTTGAVVVVVCCFFASFDFVGPSSVGQSELLARLLGF